MTRLLTHLRSRRAILIAAASLFGFAGLFTPKPWSQLAGTISLIGFALVILQLSERVTGLHAGVESTGRSLKKLQSEIETSKQKVVELDPRPGRRLAFAIETLTSPVTDPESARVSMQAANRAGNPLITVVVPCHNEARFVSETLRSILTQSFEDWECIVVDDASTDDSLAEIWTVANRDERIRVLRHFVNSGLSAARNTGLRAARGRFVTFLDSDDLLLTDSLLDRVASLVNALDDDHVIGSYSDVKVDVEDLTLDDYPSRLGRQRNGVVDLISADAECPFPAHAPLLLTDRVRSLGGFDETMRHGAEDWDLWYRAMRNGYIFVPSAYRTIVYRQKRGSMVRALAGFHVEEANRLIDAAYRDADPSIMVSPSPTPLDKPLSYYQSLIRRSDRAIRFAMMALIEGDDDAARKSLDTLREAPAALIARHLDLDDLIDRGIERALSINTQDLKLIDTRAESLRRRLRDLLEDTLSRWPASRPEEAENPIVGALLIPCHSGQAAALFAAAQDRHFERGSLGVLVLDRETGSQGVTSELPDGVRSWSLNEWVLKGASTKVVFTGRVLSGLAEEVCNALRDEGAEVVVVALDTDDLMTLKRERRDTPDDMPHSFLGRPPANTGPARYEPTELWEIEEYPGTRFDARELGALKDVHRGERVVIIGNGPSLNSHDLTKLANENTIAVNGIFYASDRMTFNPTYYVVEDTAFMRDNLDMVSAYQAGHKFFPSIYRRLIGDAPDVTYFMMNRGFYERRSPNYCVPRFSMNPAQTLFSGQSVTIINLQLAFHLGFAEVVLIGMDFSYSVPDSALVEGDLVTSTGADPNHFHPDYFGAGKVWKDPKLDRVLANYALAKRVFEAQGRRIVNASDGGQLELFERIDYERLFT